MIRFGKMQFQFKKPKPHVLILSGIFMLSLYGALTRLPEFLGIVAFVLVLLTAAVGAYYILRSF